VTLDTPKNVGSTSRGNQFVTRNLCENCTQTQMYIIYMKLLWTTEVGGHKI